MTDEQSRQESPWATSEHAPCPDHGKAHFDASGRCLPSCGFGWERDPLLIVRDEALAEEAA